MSVTFVTSVFPTPNQFQLNALYSWNLAKIPTVVVGKVDDPAGLIARFPNVLHVPQVRTARDLGLNGNAPLVKDVIKSALPFIETRMVGLINADILIKENFKFIMDRVLIKHRCNIFLSGPRYDLPNGCEFTRDMNACSEKLPPARGKYWTYSLNSGFEVSYWNGGRWVIPMNLGERISHWIEYDPWGSPPSKRVAPIDTPDKLRATFRTDQPHQDQSGDIFIGSKANFERLAQEMPDFFMGRMLWDNWIHLWFSSKGIRCFNTNPLLPTFHPDHDRCNDGLAQHNASVFNFDPTNLIYLHTWPSITK